ncbi:MAG: peptidase M28, partial [Flavobacteriaceae bacterium]|nr:peptidase M28 [Flavobacteriaceae bacterium]
MIRLLLLLTLALTVSCNSAQNATSKKMTAEEYANTINAENLKTDL